MLLYQKNDKVCKWFETSKEFKKCKTSVNLFYEESFNALHIIYNHFKKGF